MIELSVIVPFYIYDDLAQDFLDSIIIQTFDRTKFEISLAICNSEYQEAAYSKLLEFTSKHLDINWIVTKADVTPPGLCRNVAISHISDSSKYIYSMDADDYLCSEKALEIIYNNMLDGTKILYLHKVKYWNFLNNTEYDYRKENFYTREPEIYPPWRFCYSRSALINHEYNGEMFNEDLDYICSVLGIQYVKNLTCNLFKDYWLFDICDDIKEIDDVLYCHVLFNKYGLTRRFMDENNFKNYKNKASE